MKKITSLVLMAIICCAIVMGVVAAGEATNVDEYEQKFRRSGFTEVWSDSNDIWIFNNRGNPREFVELCNNNRGEVWGKDGVEYWKGCRFNRF